MCTFLKLHYITIVCCIIFFQLIKNYLRPAHKIKWQHLSLMAWCAFSMNDFGSSWNKCLQDKTCSPYQFESKNDIDESTFVPPYIIQKVTKEYYVFSTLPCFRRDDFFKTIKRRTPHHLMNKDSWSFLFSLITFNFPGDITY